MGSIPGPRKFHMLWSSQAHTPQLLNPHSRACEPQLLSLSATAAEAHMCRTCALQLETPLQRESRIPQGRLAPATVDPVQPKITD